MTGDAVELLEILDRIATNTFADMRVRGIHLTDSAKFAIRSGLRAAAQYGEREAGHAIPLEALVRSLRNRHGVQIEGEPRDAIEKRVVEAYRQGSDYQHEKETVPAPRPPDRRRKDRDP